MPAHYCAQHQTKFFKNEKIDRIGKLNVWYSHKMLDGQGFCVEKDTEVTAHDIARPVRQLNSQPNSQYMLMCNAMNNAIALAASDKIQLDQIGNYYQKILSELQRNA